MRASRPAWGEGGGRTLSYRVAIRFRPLLFWIGRDNVGEVRLRWLAGPDAEEGVEFLGGLDPSQAPRRLNKWGYLREMETSSGARVFGLMTQSDEGTLAELENSSGRSSEGLQVYKVTHGTMTQEGASAGVQKVALPKRLTFRDLETVLAQVPGPSVPRSIAVPAGAKPGFCLAMTSLLHEQVETWRRTAVASSEGSLTYVHAARVYAVKVRSSRLLRRVTVGGREYRNVLETEFESRREGRSTSDRFKISYGTEGPLRDAPIRIVYRRNWWSEIEAVLVAD
jgi:hypothetical protein